MLVRYECIDGGWCYYDDFDYQTQRPSGSTISFVTATVLVVLDDARKAGIPVPQKIVDRAVASILRQRKRDFSYDYGEYLKYRPMLPVNRPGGSLGRSQACNLALRAWGDKQVTDAVVETWLDRLFARELWLDMGRKRPIPHESWFQVAGYFFYYGHYYAGRCIELLPPAEASAATGPIGPGSLAVAGTGRKLVGFPLVRLPPAVRHGLRADEPGAMQTRLGAALRECLQAPPVRCKITVSSGEFLLFVFWDDEPRTSLRTTIMSLTITVPDPLARLLQSRARAEKIPVDELASRLLETGMQNPLEPGQWSIANQRRVALIEKRFRKSLTEQEQEELQQLQELADHQLEELDALMLKDVALMETTARRILKGAE